MSTAPLSLIILEDEIAHVNATLFAFEDSDPPVEIRVARTLREYIGQVAERAPDIALLDLNVPDADSVEVIAVLSKSHPFPVLVMTSLGDEAIAVAAMKAGALDYLVKSPDAFANMPQTVHRVLREWNASEYRRQAGDQARAYTLLTEAIQREHQT